MPTEKRDEVTAENGNDGVKLIKNTASIGTFSVTEVNECEWGLAEDPKIKITGERDEGVDGSTAVDNTAFEIPGVTGKENDDVTLVENAVINKFSNGPSLMLLVTSLVSQVRRRVT